MSHFARCKKDRAREEEDGSGFIVRRTGCANHVISNNTSETNNHSDQL